MDIIKCFTSLFKSYSDYGKIVLIIFIVQNDKKLLREIGFSECDINRLNLEFKNILKEHREEYLDYVKNEEQSNVEKFSSK